MHTNFKSKLLWRLQDEAEAGPAYLLFSARVMRLGNVADCVFLAGAGHYHSDPSTFGHVDLALTLVLPASYLMVQTYGYASIVRDVLS